VHAALKALEARPAGVVESDNLTVEDRLAHPELPDQPAQLRIALADVAEVPALQP